jgi:hypothetical protein
LMQKIVFRLVMVKNLIWRYFRWKE